MSDAVLLDILAGRKRALELLLTGDPFAPARALEIGLVNMIVPHRELLSAARELARRIIRHSPLAIGGIITAVTRGLNMGIGDGLQIESEQFAAMVPTHDFGEGLAAWVERRPPNYNGHNPTPESPATCAPCRRTRRAVFRAKHGPDRSRRAI
jgi:enoyl-CoA hydratase